MTPFTVAVLQGPGELGDALAAMDRAAGEAARAGAALLVMPELFLTGYNIGVAAIGRLAEARDGASARTAAEIARRHGVALLYGYPEREGDAVYNAALLVRPDGVTAHYRKTHLFGTMEKAAFRAGDEACVVAEVGGARVGVLICYDVEFPEAVRALALRGADVVAVPTALMRPFEFVPRCLVPTRAYENAVYVVYANRTGTEGELTYTGESCVAAPDGSVPARAGTGEALIHTALDPALLAAMRARNPYLMDRRPELYG